MQKTNGSRVRWMILVGLVAILAREQHAVSQPRKAKYASQADLERLEKKLDEHQALVMRLLKLQQQYLQSLSGAIAGDPGAATPPAATTVMPPTPNADLTPVPQPAVAIKPKPKLEPVKPAPNPKAVGTIVGKIKGASDAVIYLDISAPSARGTALMKQEGKQFVPRVLVVQKGTKVDFPNMDAVFHNVFSVTPDNSFDLGSYRQGEAKSVTLVKPGVVTVYCNMHPQMVGHVLVVPSPYHTRAGKDGFFKLANIPAGRHKIIAWAPNAKPVVTEVEVADGEAATVELQVGARSSTNHTNKEGLPYGSYKD